MYILMMFSIAETIPLTNQSFGKKYIILNSMIVLVIYQIKLSTFAGYNLTNANIYLLISIHPYDNM